MSVVRKGLKKAVLVIITSASAVWPLQAQTPLSSKPIQLIIDTGVGGSYDLWSRAIARHIGAYLPGTPTIIPQNMPGAGGLTATNYLYNIAPKDGTTLGMVSLDTATTSITNPAAARFDARRFSWIGSPTSETIVVIASSKSGVEHLSDLYQKPLVVGGVGAGSGTSFYPRALEALLGLKFKVVDGYNTTPDMFLAMDRGELDGIVLAYSTIALSRPEWLKNKQVNILLQGGAEPNPVLPGVPFVLELAKTDEQRQSLSFLFGGNGLGRPLVAPPGVPAGTLESLRDAFDATVRDPAFISEVQQGGMILNPSSGVKLDEIVRHLYETPKPIVEKVAGYINPE